MVFFSQVRFTATIKYGKEMNFLDTIAQNYDSEVYSYDVRLELLDVKLLEKQRWSNYPIEQQLKRTIANLKGC